MKKRMLSIITMILALVLIFSGCSGIGSGEKKKVVAKAEPFVQAEEMKTQTKVISIEELDERLEKAINLRGYKKLDGDEIEYYMSGKRAKYHDDIQFSLHEETQIKFPVSANDMESAGWIKEKESGMSSRFSKDEVSLKLFRFSGGAGLEENKYNGIQIALYEIADKEKDENSGSEVISFEKNNAPGFVVCDEITQKSTVSDIVDILGKPQAIASNIINGTFAISYYIQNKDKGKDDYSLLRFEFTLDGNYMTAVEYKH